MAFEDYEEKYSPADHEFVRPEQKKLDSAAYWVESIMDRLYDQSGPLDTGSLACDLDELCYILGVKTKKGLLQVQRKYRMQLNEFLSDMEA